MPRIPGVFLLVLGSCSSPPPAPPGIAELFERSGFNGVVLVADRGAVVFRRAYGLKSFETGERLDEESLFEIGSISKPLTAVAIHQLVERGRMSLDDPLPRFFPKLPYAAVTIRGMLSHTSGLFDVYGDPALREKFRAFYGRTDRPYSNLDYLAFLEAFPPPLVAGPGEKDHYSNTAYVLLALIVEQVSGVTFDAFLRENILAPAGMRRTVVLSLPAGRRVDGLATGHETGADGRRRAVVQPPDPPRVYGMTYGDDEIATTADDLLAFDRALRSGRLVKPETLERILVPPTLSSGRPAAYALGFAVGEQDGVRVISHGGSTAGFMALCRFSAPDNEATVVLLSNVPTESRVLREAAAAVQRLLRR
jgi:CubicO group peptidase (beta-lactamase class C family)